MSVALHQTDPDQVYIGARYDGEIYGTEDGGATLELAAVARGGEGHLFRCGRVGGGVSFRCQQITDTGGAVRPVGGHRRTVC